MARIFHLLSEDLPSGTLKQVELLCRELGTYGFENWVCSVEPRRDRQVNLPSFGGRLSFCSYHWKLDPTFIPRLLRQLRRVNPAIVQTWGDTAGQIGTLIAALPGATPSVRAIRSFETKSSYLPLIDQWMDRQTTRIIANSIQLKAALAARGVAAHLIDVVVNAVEPTLDIVRPLHDELSLDHSVRFAAVVGDLRVKKQIKDLIWAMDLLRVIHPEMHLVIVGEGEELDRLKQFDRDVHLDQCVHFLGRRADVREVLSQCFCLWQASRDEGCSNAVLEAMSVGLPVIASDIPGHSSIVVHGETGYLVPLGDCAEFARKTNWLLHNAERRQEMGAAGRSLVHKQHPVDQMIDGYRRIYQSVIDSRSGRAA